MRTLSFLGQPVGGKGDEMWWEKEDGIIPLNVKEERPQLELEEEERGPLEEEEERDLLEWEQERDLLKEAKDLWEKEKRDPLEKEEEEVEAEDGRDGLRPEVKDLLEEEETQLMALKEEVERLWRLVEQTRTEVNKLEQEGQWQRRRDQETQAVSHTTPVREDDGEGIAEEPDEGWYSDANRAEGKLEESASWEKTPEQDWPASPDTPPNEEPMEGFELNTEYGEIKEEEEE